MKKLFLLLLALAVTMCSALLLLGCDDENANDAGESAPSSIKDKNDKEDKDEAPSSSSSKKEPEDTDEKPDENDKIDYKKYKLFIADDFEPQLLSIGVRKGNDALLAEINSVINLWVEDGTLSDYIDYYTNLDLYLNNKIDKMPGWCEQIKTTWDFKNATEVITVYTSSGFAPFEFTVEGEIVGVDIAIMSQVAENMGKRIEIKDMDFDSIFSKTAAHEGDAVAAAGIIANEARKQYLDFSDIYSSGHITIASKNNQYSLIEQLQPLKLGAIHTYIQDYGLVNSEFTVYHTVEEAFVALENGYIDALVFQSYSCLFAHFGQEP